MVMRRNRSKNDLVSEMVNRRCEVVISVNIPRPRKAVSGSGGSRRVSSARCMIGEEELRAMKPTAYIVNVARAAIIEEEFLYRALSERRIAGAAIDVWWTPHFWDPLWNPEGKPASEYPFWELPNVICTPHSVVSSDSRSDAGLKIMVENILRVKRGEPPTNQVDKKLRY